MSRASPYRRQSAFSRAVISAASCTRACHDAPGMGRAIERLDSRLEVAKRRLPALYGRRHVRSVSEIMVSASSGPQDPAG